MTRPVGLSGPDVRRKRFRETPGGYDASAVRQLLVLIAERIDLGISPAELINNWGRERVSRGRGYDPDEVDGFLKQVDRFCGETGSTPAASGSTPDSLSDPWRAGVGRPRRFDDLTGTRLTYRHPKLLSPEGEVLVKVPAFGGLRTAHCTARNRTYTLRFVYGDPAGRREAQEPDHDPDPNIAALAALRHRLVSSDFQRLGEVADVRKFKGHLPYDLLAIRELIDDTSGLPMLWTIGGRGPAAATFIAFPDHRLLQIPTSGAVDQFGTRHFLFNRVKVPGITLWGWYMSSYSVIVNPTDELSDDLLLAIALAIRFADLGPAAPGGFGGG